MNDARFMATALTLGRRGQGQVWPNPAVGCVIVQEGRIVGRGWTQPGGRPHAETEALARAGTAARGATAYVTLEPCAHHGRTPPCAQALIDAGVARVVVATTDSDPRVAGRGIVMLQAAGIEVTTGVGEAEARQDHMGFFSRIDRGRPALTLKLAQSFDGRIATPTGESKWITGPAARRLTHAMRARHDAVMVGAGTVRADDPALTVRDMGAKRQPARIVVSDRLDLPLMSQLARTAAEVPVFLCHGPGVDTALRETWRGLGARLIECRRARGRIDVADMMGRLAGEGLNRVFCEGGGALAASLLGAELVDELVGFGAGLVLGADGRPGVGPLGLQRLAAAPRFTLQRTARIGEDVLHVWRRVADPLD